MTKDEVISDVKDDLVQAVANGAELRPLLDELQAVIEAFDDWSVYQVYSMYKDGEFSPRPPIPTDRSNWIGPPGFAPHMRMWPEHKALVVQHPLTADADAVVRHKNGTVCLDPESCTGGWNEHVFPKKA